MKRIFFAFFLCSTISFSQNSGTVPTANDLRTAFISVCKGDTDLMQILPGIKKYGDAVIPSLFELLDTPPVTPSDSTPAAGTIEIPVDSTSTEDSTQFIQVSAEPFRSDNPDEALRQRQSWYYAAMAIEGIGTDYAYSSLQRLAKSHQDKDVRGFAMNALSNSYYDKCISDSTRPDPELLHIFIINIDDTTRVSTLQTTVGSIARGGMLRWTDIDFGQIVQPSAEKKKAREAWWQNVGSKMKWNKITGRFE